MPRAASNRLYITHTQSLTCLGMVRKIWPKNCKMKLFGSGDVEDKLNVQINVHPIMYAQICVCVCVLWLGWLVWLIGHLYCYSIDWQHACR